jgi:hypothetical protein
VTCSPATQLPGSTKQRAASSKLSGMRRNAPTRPPRTQSKPFEPPNLALAVCPGCPVSNLCTAWAEVDEYTGLAAGQA